MSSLDRSGLAFRRAALRFAGAALAVLLLPQMAFASLGGDLSSVDADRARMQGAVLRIVRADQYVLHEIRSASGTTIREYVSSTGTVFAVAWDGPWLPDMQQVLGPFFERYQQAAQMIRQARRGRGPLSIVDADFVVQTGGHQRAFTGRAYLPARLPQGVQTDSIR
jgi:hypothetical protein